MTRQSLFQSKTARVALLVCLATPGVAAAGPLAFGEDESLRRAEQIAARKESYRRQVQARSDEQRADLVAFGSGSTGLRVRASVRKYLRLLESGADAGDLLSESVSSLPAADFRPNDRLLALLSDDGRLPRAPAAFSAPTTARWESRLDAAWSECVDALRRGEAPSHGQVSQLERDLKAWKDSTPTLEDRKQRLAAQGHFRDLGLLIQSLADTRCADRLRNRLAGFPGGSLIELANWMLNYDLSARAGTPGQRHISRLSAELVRQFDRNRGTAHDSVASPPDFLAQSAVPAVTIPDPLAAVVANVPPALPFPDPVPSVEAATVQNEANEETVVPRRAAAAQPGFQPEPSVGR